MSRARLVPVVLAAVVTVLVGCSESGPRAVLQFDETTTTTSSTIADVSSFATDSSVTAPPLETAVPSSGEEAGLSQSTILRASVARTPSPSTTVRAVRAYREPENHPASVRRGYLRAAICAHDRRRGRVEHCNHRCHAPVNDDHGGFDYNHDAANHHDRANDNDNAANHYSTDDGAHHDATNHHHATNNHHERANDNHNDNGTDDGANHDCRLDYDDVRAAAPEMQVSEPTGLSPRSRLRSRTVSVALVEVASAWGSPLM